MGLGSGFFVSEVPLYKGAQKGDIPPFTVVLVIEEVPIPAPFSVGTPRCPYNTAYRIVTPLCPYDTAYRRAYGVSTSKDPFRRRESRPQKGATTQLTQVVRYSDGVLSAQSSRGGPSDEGLVTCR